MHFLLNQCYTISVLVLMVCFYLVLIDILSVYVDDIIVIVRNQEDGKMLGNIVEKFGKISAAKVNWAKSEASAAVGSWSAGLPQLPGWLSWRRGGLKYLGVYVGD